MEMGSDVPAWSTRTGLCDKPLQLASRTACASHFNKPQAISKPHTLFLIGIYINENSRKGVKNPVIYHAMVLIGRAIRRDHVINDSNSLNDGY
jgi:hypothetical protein